MRLRTVLPVGAIALPARKTDAMTVRHVNPEGMHQSPAFSQAVVVEAPTKTIYIGGQNGVGPDGQVVGDTLGAQSAQAFANLATILEAEGATLADVVAWTIVVVDGHPIQEGLAAFQAAWDPADPPPAISVNVVASMANPAFLVEITAIAVL
jgi:enamine deaminase RidA (YjgF/YER057c/UK114 family)